MIRSASDVAHDQTPVIDHGPAIEVTELVKSFADAASRRDRVRAVDGISFTVERGTMFTLLGPSGCGKTTTLRCIAGLETPDAGTIIVDGRTFTSGAGVVHIPANRRGIGMVFQSYAIWPHMDVYDNVAFPLTAVPRSQRPARAEIRARVGRVLDVVQLGDLSERPATDLSGGQQQRLALARALVMEPPLLLLDEPLSNLDANLREEMRFELKRLQRELGITTVYVTHDQIEALSMSKNVAVMNAGRIEQVGRPREIYDKPASRFVAGFIGVSNLFAGVVSALNPGGIGTVDTEYGRLRVDLPHAAILGSEVLVATRPEQIVLETSLDGAAEWVGTVHARAFVGDAVEHIVRMPNGYDVRAKSEPTISIPPGTLVRVRIIEERCTIVPG